MNSPDNFTPNKQTEEQPTLTQIQAQIAMIERDQEKLRAEFYDFREDEDPQSPQLNTRQKEAWATIELYDEKLKELRKLEQKLK